MRPGKLYSLPKILDERGNLSFLESNHHIPFEIRRTYWIYDVPGGEIRGGHAFYEQEEFIVAISGSFDVVVNDGKNEMRQHLNRSYKGLYIPNGLWRHMDNFSTNSIALVIASTPYDEDDYIRAFELFRAYRQTRIRPAVPHKMIKRIIEGYEAYHDNQSSLIELNKVHQDKGNITVIENGKNIRFDTKRVYYLYDVPGGESRGGHAHKKLHQLVIAAGGSFDVILDDGKHKQKISLNRPYQGLHIVPGIWRELVNFSSGATCLVLASEFYDEKDYIRDYEKFLEFKNGNEHE